ncbi:hypothetical protein B0H11DRAFT_2259796 [Mycena galericulata]|nr:hypothetical protein B0H11DRAFT_2259796 [Mycena galericulata]
MAEILGAMRFLTHFRLGPPVDTGGGQTMQYYIDSETSDTVKALLIGVVAKILDAGDDIKARMTILLLVAPGPEAPVIRLMYDEQTQVLDDVLTAERVDTSRVVFTRQHWCQGAGSVNGVVFVRILPRTLIDRTDFSTESATYPYESVGPEIPFGDDTGRDLYEGALVACCVQMFRVDDPVFAGEDCGVYNRAYVLDAISCHRFTRSKCDDPMETSERSEEGRT